MFTLIICLIQTSLALDNPYGTVHAPAQRAFTPCPGLTQCNVIYFPNPVQPQPVNQPMR